MNKQSSLKIVILGLSITSSWGNGHATTYRGLIRELNDIGHSVLFLERNVPWYEQNRDLPSPGFCKVELYNSIDELKSKFAGEIKMADLVIVGSYVPEGVTAGEFVVSTANGITAFYDIDTPVTLAKLKRQDYEYINTDLIKKYDMYLSFTGGPMLEEIEKSYGSPCARPLYCSFDPDLYFHESNPIKWDMGYLGTYSSDRQPSLNNLLIDAAVKTSRFNYVVAGPQFPENIKWPQNVERINHLPPGKHRNFYNSQRFTLNITRTDMIKAGYSPSVRLFEAAACGIPVISDYWKGLNEFFIPGKEILISESADDTLNYLLNISENERIRIGKRAQKKVLEKHTARHRANELIDYYSRLLKVSV